MPEHDSETRIGFYESQRGPLRLTVPVLCQDPLVCRSTGMGPVQVHLEGERYLADGPTSARVEVRDEDPSDAHPRAKVLKNGKGFAMGAYRKNPRASIQFHQVNVWAIANRVLALLEEPNLLGRPIPWASGRGRLILVPHAGPGGNAYYDPKEGALRFQYLGDGDERVYSCLSHDIITHELGHAILDGLKPAYDQVSSPQTAAFHEYFGDALALTSALTFRELVVRAVGDAPLVLEAEFLDHLGEELGMADSRGDRQYVRRFSDRWTLSDLEQNGNQNPHDLSQVLSGIFFDFLRFLYELKFEEASEREGRRNGQVAVAALVNAARQAARTMLCAIDYCPPVDVSFLQYAQAVLRADEVAFPRDHGARAKLIDLFVDRGIACKPSDLDVPRMRNRDLHPYDVDALSETSEASYRFLDENRVALRIPITCNFKVVRRYKTRKVAGNGFFPPREIVLEFVWTEDVELIGESYGALAGTFASLQCGGTLVLDTNGNVLHYVLAEATTERKERLKRYIAFLVKRGDIGLGDDDKVPISAFREGRRVHLHRAPHLRHIERDDPI